MKTRSATSTETFYVDVIMRRDERQLSVCELLFLSHHMASECIHGYTHPMDLISISAGTGLIYQIGYQP